MEDDTSKKYVVQLLKQLEELKRKKALKEKKLQKLKKVNTGGTKGQSSKVLGPSKLSKTVATSNNIENSLDMTVKDENHKQNSVHVESNILELKSNEKQNCHAYNSLYNDRNNINDNKIENPNDVSKEQLLQNIQDIEESYNKNEVNVSANLIFFDKEKKTVPSPIFEKESVIKSSNCTNQKSADNLNEISHSYKRKSSDILDESLNSNMSCFLSSDLFSTIDDKKENIVEKKLSSVCTEKSIPVESIGVHTLVPNMPSPIIPEPILHKTKTNNIEDFNFPKFSTPSSGIYISSNSQSLTNLSLKPVEENSCLPDIIKTSSEAVESVSNLKKTYENDNHLVYNTSHITSILGKGLSSILDAHYQSPKKSISTEKRHSQEGNVDSARKRRKLFSDSEDSSKPPAEMSHNIKSCNLLKDISEDSKDADKDDPTDGLDFDTIEPFHSDSFSDMQKTPTKSSSGDAQSQITKTVNEMVIKVSDNPCITESKSAFAGINDDKTNKEFDKSAKVDSELLIVPETEGIFLSKDEDFLESLTLSQHLNDCDVKDNLLNASSQSRLESPIVNQIVAAVKKSVSNSNFSENTIQTKAERESSADCTEKPHDNNFTKQSDSSFENSFVIDTSHLEDGSQMLGNCKHIPFNTENNIQESKIACERKVESNLSLICSLGGTSNEAVIDVEMVKFNDFLYAFIQQKTQIHVWRQEKETEWTKIFNHQVEDLSIAKICVTMDDDKLVTVLLLSNDEQYCLQFLLFEKDAAVFKLMENTHWLEERDTDDSLLLCGLDRLMFATGQVKECYEVSLHAFLSMNDCPRLMTAVLGLTDDILCSLCKMQDLPNALLGLSESVLYVWHILEARLLTCVSLHPSIYLPIQQCFWATAEKGLVFLLTTCKSEDNDQVCQLLAANLATGFCQVVMTYSTRPSGYKIAQITKAVYKEPFILVSHLNGAMLWSISEEYCSAALLSKSDVTSIAVCKDFENWGLITVGSKRGFINCYGLKG